jgi:hypothetical protein
VLINDENSRIRIQYPDPNPDQLDRGMDPRIRILPKMSWIRNTVKNRKSKAFVSFVNSKKKSQDFRLGLGLRNVFEIQRLNYGL